MAIERKKDLMPEDQGQNEFDSAFESPVLEEKVVEEPGAVAAEMPIPEESASPVGSEVAEKTMPTDEKENNRYKTLQGILASTSKQYEQQIAQLEAALAKAAQQGQQGMAPAMPEAAPATPEAAPAMATTADNVWGDYQDALGYVEGEYGADLARAMMGVTETTINKVLGDILPKYTQSLIGQIGEQLAPAFQHYDQVLAPIRERQMADDAEKHKKAIADMHPDLDSLDTNAIGAWIEDMGKLDPNLGNAYRNIAENGTAKQVGELLLPHFKWYNNIADAAPAQQQGMQAQAAEQPMQVPPQQGATPVPPDPKTMQQLMNASTLKNTGTKGTDIGRGAIPNDFDSAFDALTGQIAGAPGSSGGSTGMA